MRDRFQEDLFCEPPTWLVFYHLQSHSLWERSRTHRVERKKDEKSEVSYTEFLAGVINLRCKTPEDWDFDQPKIAAPAVGRSGCGRNKTDFYGLHGHSFVLTSMEWLGGLRCCVAQGEKKSLVMKLDETWRDTWGWKQKCKTSTWCCSLRTICFKIKDPMLICIRETTLWGQDARHPKRIGNPGHDRQMLSRHSLFTCKHL